MNKILLGLMLLLSMSAYAEEFPAGLRLPTKQELAEDPSRNESPTKFAKVTADFNGDGKPDTAFLLVNVKNHKRVLAVKLSSENSYEWKIIDKGEFDWSYPQMAISSSEPGENYKTSCGAGLTKCSKNEPKSFTLKNSGLWYSPMDQGGAQLFAWNHKKIIFEVMDVGDAAMD